jgi:hypothetical protein
MCLSIQPDEQRIWVSHSLYPPLTPGVDQESESLRFLVSDLLDSSLAFRSHISQDVCTDTILVL